MWRIESPGGGIILQVEQNAQGGLVYSVTRNEKPILEHSAMGCKTNLCDFSQGLVFENEEATVISETYTLPAGKKAVYVNNCEERVLHFRKAEHLFTLVLRVYDDGIAFRYKIPGEGDLLIHNETTEFSFAQSFDTLWLQDWVATYEEQYCIKHPGRSPGGRRFGMPALLYAPHDGIWAMVNEASVLNANGYCVSHLLGTDQNVLRLAFAPEEGSNPLKLRRPFESPWRYILIVKSLDEAVNATLSYNLNPPAIIHDTSWIKPGRALWAWWAEDKGAQTLSDALRYVDFAQAMGFEAVLLDAGWDETWIAQFCAYAHAHGVSPWIWTYMQNIDTPEKAQRLLPLWKSYGVDGVKIDFFENDSAHTASCYRLMAEIMAKEQLMINFHGATKPMGEGRTWPHLMTSEGVMGLEYYKWSDMPDARHNCTLPFIRNAVGPMDYTPTGFSNHNRNTTMAHQMALAAVFESGITHYAASIYHLEAWEGTQFLRRLKPKYDGVKLLSGFPGEYVAMLRWVQGEWVIGCIVNESRPLDLSLDFLPDGAFEAEIFGDTRPGYEITYEKISVDNKTKIHLELPEHGGAGVYITKNILPLAITAQDGYMCQKRIEILAAAMRPFGGSVFLDDMAAIRLNGGVHFAAEGLPARKRYTIRLEYSSVEAGEISFGNGKTTANLYIAGNLAPGVYAAAETVMTLEPGFTPLTARNLKSAPIIRRITLIDNDPPETEVWDADTAIASGGVEFVHVGGDICAVGLGAGGALIFDSLSVPADGQYILRLEYLAGVNGTAFVSVNGSDAIPAHLAGLGGWGSTRANERLAREILVDLPKGRCTARIFNDAAPLPALLRICLTPFIKEERYSC